jgi:SAM-dependent methyltransferase
MKFPVAAVFTLLALLPRALPAQQIDEVPFVVTPDSVTLAMLQLARVGARDYVIDLGSGDGRIVILAARRFGARGLGIEIDPRLVEESRANARSAGVETRASFREQDLFKTDLAPASVVTLYLLPEVNLLLRPRLLALRPGTRVVSHDWDMAEWVPDQTVIVDVPEKAIGIDKRSRVHLWIVPARVAGDWCGIGKQRGTSLRLTQEFQQFRARVQKRGGVPFDFDGGIEGATLRSTGKASLRLDGQRLQLQSASRAYAPFDGASFARASGPKCN